jgi:hypothetical protein
LVVGWSLDEDDLVVFLLGSWGWAACSSWASSDIFFGGNMDVDVFVDLDSAATFCKRREFSVER